MTDIATLRELLRIAVYGRRLLRVNYHLWARVVEPRALAVNQDGDDVLIAWQISGGSESPAVTGWKEFQITEIAGITVLEENFEPNPDRPPPLRAYLRVDQPPAVPLERPVGAP